ncbi:MAG: DUF1127 domain-containing protein [Pseudomonadota bacterium]
MTVVTTNTAASRPHGITWIVSLIERYKAWRAYRDTVHALSSLSDRELADIGLNRANLAYEAKHRA